MVLNSDEVDVDLKINEHEPSYEDENEVGFDKDDHA